MTIWISGKQFGFSGSVPGQKIFQQVFSPRNIGTQTTQRFSLFQESETCNASCGWAQMSRPFQSARASMNNTGQDSFDFMIDDSGHATFAWCENGWR
jgi:hypothetical protein